MWEGGDLCDCCGGLSTFWEVVSDISSNLQYWVVWVDVVAGWDMKVGSSSCPPKFRREYLDCCCGREGVIDGASVDYDLGDGIDCASCGVSCRLRLSALSWMVLSCDSIERWVSSYWVLYFSYWL